MTDSGATGVVFEIQRFSVHDGDGIRTTVFFKGCPLSCLWCHNPEGLSPAPELGYIAEKCALCGACAAACPSGAHIFQGGAHAVNRARCRGCGACAAACPTGALSVIGREMTAQAVVDEVLRDRAFYQSTGGITCSGGECTLQIDFLLAVLRLSRARGLRTAVDTCGMAERAAFERIFPYTDQFLYDVKAITPGLHRRFTGADNRQILENYAWLIGSGASVDVRVPLIPGFNDTRDEIARVAGFLAESGLPRRVKVLPYHAPGARKRAMLGREAWRPPGEYRLSPEDAQALLSGLSGLSL